MKSNIYIIFLRIANTIVSYTSNAFADNYMLYIWCSVITQIFPRAFFTTCICWNRTCSFNIECLVCIFPPNIREVIILLKIFYIIDVFLYSDVVKVIYTPVGINRTNFYLEI